MELINQKLGVDNREKIATGQVIKALILNGLGMVSKIEQEKKTALKLAKKL